MALRVCFRHREPAVRAAAELPADAGAGPEDGRCAGSSRSAGSLGGGEITLPLGARLSHACVRRLGFTDKKAEIDRLAAEYIESVKNMSAEQRVEHLRRIQSAYSKCKEYSDDKVQLAMQTYEMVSAVTPLRGRRLAGAAAGL